MFPVTGSHAVRFASALLGVTLLVTSSLFLVDWIKTDHRCHEQGERCKQDSPLVPCPQLQLACRGVSPTLPASILGLVAAVTQLVCAAFAFVRRWRFFIPVQVLSFMASLAGFTLLIGNLSDPAKYYSSEPYEWYRDMFLAASGIGFLLGSLMMFSVEHILWKESNQKLEKQEANFQHGPRSQCATVL